MVIIPQWRREIDKIVCMFEKELPMSFMDVQVHLLIHLPDEVELFWVLSCCWMFFLERYMEKLKGFIRQREKPEGSMEDGYLLYKSLYYANEYIKQIDDTIGEVVWDDHQDEEKMERGYSKQMEKGT